jgi:hypothetical protein
MLTPELILLSLLAPAPAPQQALPADALQRCATRALRGDYGHLAPWQASWYAKALATQPQPRRIWLTQYGPWEGYAGDDYHIAANPRYMVPGTVVWLSKPGQLRVVTNRGADYNDRVARSHGARHWVDLWTRYRGQYGLNTTTCDAYVLGVAGGW